MSETLADKMAQAIRIADGDNTLGAGALGEVCAEVAQRHHAQVVAKLLIQNGLLYWGNYDGMGDGWYAGDEQPSRVDDDSEFPRWLVDALDAEWARQTA